MLFNDRSLPPEVGDQSALKQQPEVGTQRCYACYPKGNPKGKIRVGAGVSPVAVVKSGKASLQEDGRNPKEPPFPMFLP